MDPLPPRNERKRPEFEAMAWWNGFKKVKLSDFKGK